MGIVTDHAKQFKPCETQTLKVKSGLLISFGSYGVF